MAPFRSILNGLMPIILMSLASCSADPSKIKIGAPGAKGATVIPAGCEKMTCFGSEPKGTWVTIATFASIECGSGDDTNESCLLDVGNRPIGTKMEVCRRSNVPDGWVTSEEHLHVPCGNAPGNAMYIERTR